MQIFKNNSTILIATIITVILLCAYAPILSLFSLRNDQTNYFLPVRMYMSDAFNHNEYMFWNPFMSGSYPIHSDMQGPVWNPITIILSWFFNYNSSLLSIELFLYYLIGSIGCFFFARNFASNTYSCFTIAISYGCGGFASSTMEFMGWMGSFAFLPWAVHFFYKILKNRTYQNAIRLSFALWLLLTSGYPSFLIFLGYSFLGAFLCYAIILYSNKKKKEILLIIKLLLASFFIFVVFSLPAIHSFLEYLPAYERGDKATFAQLNNESFSLSYPLSLIFPGGGSFWDNNIYLGIIPFLLLMEINLKKTSFTIRNNFMIIACVLTFLFSLGRSTPLRMFCAEYIPLLGKFGFSHSTRIFLLFPLYIWMAPKLDRLFAIKQNKSIVRKIKLASIMSIIILLVYIFIELPHANFKTQLIRNFYYLAAGWQIAYLGALICSSKIYSSAINIYIIIIIDLIVSILTVSPLTGLSKTPPYVYNQFSDKFYSASATPFLLYPNLREQSRLNVDSHSEINALKIIPRNDFPSNTRLDTLYKFLQDSSNFNFLFNNPFLFSENKSELKIKNLELGYNFINATIISNDTGNVVIQQTIHPRWKSKNLQNSIANYKGVFLKVKIIPGENNISLYYYKTDLQIEYIISIAALLLATTYIFIHNRNMQRSKKWRSNKQGIRVIASDTFYHIPC